MGEWRGAARVAPVLALVMTFLTGYLLGTNGRHAVANAQEGQPAVATPPNVALGIEDNWMCFVCHMDFETETLSESHLAAGVPCARCHDASEDHQQDEQLTTPPDYLFGRKEVEPLCLACHERQHQNPENVEAFREQWRGKQRENGRTILDDSVCTDCHGEHVLPPR